MKQVLPVALLLAACAFLISLVFNPTLLAPANGEDLHTPTVELRGETIRVSVADSPEEHAKGLGGRTGLGPDEGMLFVFAEDGRHSFWMKDMRFSIDIVWISHSGEVVDVRGSVAPETYPSVFKPRSDARYVLELPAGWANEHGLAIGDGVRL